MKNLVLLIVFLVIPLFAQEQAPAVELSSNIPALSDFHDVIYPIWHTGYASKDYDLLRKMVPEVNSGAEKIYNAKLPPLLQDKKKKWDENVNGFRNAVNEYNTAASADNNEALMTATEVLHTYYELLVRSIKPVLPEMEDFHKTLYVIYHKYYPQKNYSAIKELTDELISKAVNIKNAKLPSRLAEQTEAFEKASGNLYHSTLTLKEALYSNNSVLIESSVERMHTDYQKLESVFE